MHTLAYAVPCHYLQSKDRRRGGRVSKIRGEVGPRKEIEMLDMVTTKNFGKLIDLCFIKKHTYLHQSHLAACHLFRLRRGFRPKTNTVDAILA